MDSGFTYIEAESNHKFDSYHISICHLDSKERYGKWLTIRHILETKFAPHTHIKKWGLTKRVKEAGLTGHDLRMILNSKTESAYWDDSYDREEMLKIVNGKIGGWL